ncbi:MAG: hypothetical protein PHC93_04060, partial [Candidatus Omnitrophica bacterium]|nr:hypothetical protein [Candidatus Omnitrophota bacterium]
MFGFIKETVLRSKQAVIKRRAPGVNIFLHPDMPQPSISKIAEIAPLIHKVNLMEPAIKSLSDSELKGKTLQ